MKKKIDVFRAPSSIAFNSRSFRSRSLSEAVRRRRNYHVIVHELARVRSFQDAETAPYSIATFHVSILSTSFHPRAPFLLLSLLQVLG